MFPDNAFAELAKVFGGADLLVDVWLHEEYECLARDTIHTVAPDTNAVRGSAELAAGSQFERLACLEGEAVRRDGDFGQVAATGADIQARSL